MGSRARTQSGGGGVEVEVEVWRGSGGVLGASRAPDSVAAATVPPFGRCSRVTFQRLDLQKAVCRARSLPRGPPPGPPTPRLTACPLFLVGLFNVHPSIHSSPSHPRDAKPPRTPQNETSNTGSTRKACPAEYEHVRRAWPLGPCLADQSINPLRIHDDSAAGPGTRWQKPRTRAEGRQLQEAGFLDDRAPAPPCRAREKNQTVSVIAQISHRT